MSCNKDAGEDLQNKIECIEGWYPSEDGNSGYFLECPKDAVTDQNCIKSFLIVMEVENYTGEAHAILTILSTDDMGLVEDYNRELEIRTQLFLAVIEFDSERQITHQVTIEMPISSCTINGIDQIQSFTYHVGVPCFATAELQFRFNCG